jgi:hypothetical protein
MTAILKRNTRIEYTYAAGAVVPGRILAKVPESEINGLAGWYRVELTDDGGAYRCCVHQQQIRSLSNEN